MDSNTEFAICPRFCADIGTRAGLTLKQMQDTPFEQWKDLNPALPSLAKAELHGCSLPLVCAQCERDRFVVPDMYLFLTFS